MPRNREEEINQEMVVEWFARQYPKYQNLLFHIPNGQNVGRIRGYTLQRMGLVAGMPDLMLAVPWACKTHMGKNVDESNGLYLTCGLFIEMKAKKGVLRQSQRAIHSELEAQNYKVVTCYSFESAKSGINEYLRGNSYS
ncbi:MAG: hypothetical protein DRQ48_00910 [Gammaproteobacteria bacterium]|nr:MAG: hypothetical protein DRQ44_00460 [Gammaproteobacteria bacterium]RKZ72239.1 MAG: hypothetical protein DRQ48_00910 [Gammaproteobacteria bacterium]